MKTTIHNRIFAALRHPALWITLGGAILRFWGLGSESLWLDEGHTVFLIDKPFLNLADDWTQGPIFYTLEKIVCSLAGTSEFALRLVPAILGSLAIPMIFLLGRAMLSRMGGLIAATLLAVNPFAIYYSQDARPYSLFLLVALLTFYFAAGWGKEERKLFRFGWAIAVILTMYTHPYGVFVAVASGIVFLVYRVQSDSMRFVSSIRQLLITAAFASLFMIPQIRSIAEHFLSSVEMGKTQAWLHRPGLGTLVNSFANYLMTTNWRIIAFCSAGMIALTFTYRAKRTSAEARIALWVSILWIGIVMLLPMLMSATVIPFFAARYAIPALIGWILLIAVILSEWKPKLRVFGIAAVIAFSVYPLYSYYTLSDKDPWRETAAILESRERAEENVVVYPGFQKYVLDYYLSGSDADPTYLNPEGETGVLPTDKDVVLWVQGYDWYATDTLSYIEDLKREGFTQESEIRVMDSVKKNPRTYYMADIRLIRYVRGNKK